MRRNAPRLLPRPRQSLRSEIFPVVFARLGPAIHAVVRRRGCAGQASAWRAWDAITSSRFIELSPMHDIRSIRDNPDAFDRALARRGLEPQAKRLIELDEKRRAAIQTVEAAQARRNAASKEIGAARKNKDEETAKGLLIEVAALKEVHSGDGDTGEGGFQGARGRIGAGAEPAARRCARRQGRERQYRASPLRRSGRTTFSRPGSISISAKRSVKWISKPQRNSPAHALWC